jgi:hypothetical protein
MVPVITIHDPCMAAELVESKVTKPYTPYLENLLPACRVRLYIDNLLVLARDIQNSPRQEQDADQLWDDLEYQLIQSPPQFMTNDDIVSSKGYVVASQRTKTPSSGPPIIVSPDIVPSSRTTNTVYAMDQMLQTWGGKQQWSILKKRQSDLERTDLIRAALNAYTNNLVFGADAYIFTGTPEERKRRIRNDSLPDVTTVIRSDLDLRDLYRNQVLTAMEDAKAEFQYQLQTRTKDILQDRENSNHHFNDKDDKNLNGNLDELVEILQQAQQSCSDWFRFVPEDDVQMAMEVVKKEHFLSNNNKM